jgi:hypothetical protein
MGVAWGGDLDLGGFPDVEGRRVTAVAPLNCVARVASGVLDDVVL